MTAPAPRFCDVLLDRLQGSDDRAVVGAAGVLSGRELLAVAGGAAALLDAWQVERGPVPALLSSSPVAYALLVAGLLTGRPLAPLSARSSAAELREVLLAGGATHLVAEPSAAALAQEAADGVPGLAVHVVGEVAPDEGQVWAGRAGDTALVLHTSGTTGAPRAVPVSQQRLAARVPVLAGLLDLGPGDLFCSGAPLHHVSGAGQGLVALATGAAVATVPWFSLEAWDWVRSAAPTHVMLVPTMLQMLLDAQALDVGMRCVVYGAAPVRPDTVRAVLQALPQARLCQLFGQTEASPLTVLDHGAHLSALAGHEERLGSVGRPVPGVELHLADVGDDGVGEVVVRAGHTFAAGKDGWVRTGDLGRLDADGYLYLTGRRGDMIIRGGENVYPEQVERVLSDHPGVREVAVVGREDARLGQVPVAFVVPVDADDPPAEEDLRAFARERLAAYKVPTRWSTLEALPVSPAGKLLRRALPA